MNLIFSDLPCMLSKYKQMCGKPQYDATVY